MSHKARPVVYLLAVLLVMGLLAPLVLNAPALAQGPGQRPTSQATAAPPDESTPSGTISPTERPSTDATPTTEPPLQIGPPPAPGVPDPAQSNITPASQSVTNNDTAANVVVTVRDSTGAPVANAAVTVTVNPAPPPTGVVLTPLSGFTNAQGQFTVAVRSTLPVAQFPQISFQALVDIGGSNFVQITGSPSEAVVTFTQSPAVLANSSVTPPTQNVEANNTTEAVITVELRDATPPSGNPVQGRSVTIAPQGGPTGLTFTTPTTQTTDVNGRAEFRVRSSAVQNVSFVVTNTTDNFALPAVTVNFTQPSPDPNNSSATVNPASAPADGVTTVTVTVNVRDAGNNPIQNANVSLSGAPGFVTITPASGTTNAQGQASFTVRSTAPTTLNLSAAINVPGAGSINEQVPTITFTTAPANQGQSTITGPQTAPADGVTTRAITVTLRNAGGFPVAGRNVGLSSNQPATTTITPSAGGVTNSSGQITFQVASTFVGAVTFTTNNIDGFTLSTTVTFTAPPTDINVSTVTRTPASVPADGVSEVVVTVTLRHLGGGIVPGKTADIELQNVPPGANVTITPDAGQTDPAQGRFVFRVKAQSSTAFVATIVARDTASNLILAQQPTVQFTVPPASTANSTVNAVGEVPPNPLQVEANGVAQATIRVTLRDQGNNPLPGKTVQITPAPATGVVCSPANCTAVTNAQGIADILVRSTNIATVTFTAVVVTDNNLALTDTAVVQFTDPPIDVSRSTIAANPTSVVANGVAESTITVVARNSGNNFAVGKQLELQIVTAPNQGAVSILPTPFAATNANGQAEWRVRSTVAQAVQFRVRIIGGTAPNDFIGPVTVTFTASTGPVDGTKSTITVSPSTRLANGTEQATITAILRDATGTVVQGKTVTLQTTPTPLPAGVNLSAASGPSDGSGRVTWTISSTTPGTFSFAAIVDSQFINTPEPGGSNQVVFNPTGGNVDANRSSVEVISGNPGLADNTTPTVIRVTLRDANNNPLQNVPVALQSSRAANDTIQPASANTNAQGQVDFNVRSNLAGTSQFTAVADGTVTLAQRPSVVFNPVTGPGEVSPTNSTVTISGPAPADGASTITVTVTLRDSANNPVPNRNVTVASSRGSLTDTIQPASATSDAQGVATFTIRSIVPGTGNVIVTGGPVVLAAQPNFTFTATNSQVDPNQSTITANPVSAPADGTTPIVVTVTLRNTAGTPLSGLFVQLNTNPQVSVQTVNATTNAQGQAIFQLRSNTPQPNVIVSAIGDNVPLAVPVSVSFTATTTISPTNSTISASPNTAPADGTSQITFTVTARDNANQPVAGRAVTLTSTPPGVNFTAVSGTTNAQGVATFTGTSSTPGTYTVSANIGGTVINQTASVTYTPTAGGISPTLSTVVAAPTSAPANGTSAITVTVTVRNTANQPVSGATVSLAVTPNTVNITPPTGTTNAQGVATFTLTSTTPGTYTIVATADGTILTNQPQVTFTSTAVVDPNTSTLVINPAGPLPANGTASYTATVTVRDAQSNPIPNKVVTLNATPNTVNISPASTTTNAQGQAIFTITSTTPGNYTFTASADAVTFGSQQRVFSPVSGGAPDLSVSKAASAPTFTSGQTAFFTITVLNSQTAGPTTGPITVTDFLLAPLTFLNGSGSGFTCALNGTNVDCTRTTPMQPGEQIVITLNVQVGVVAASTTLTNLVTVSTVGDTNTANNTANVSYTINPAGSVVIDPNQSTVVANPTTVPADNTTRTTITVTLRTSAGTPVAGASVSLTAAPNLGVTIEGTSTTTDANGTITFTARASLTTTTPVTFTAVATPPTGGSVTLTSRPIVTFTAGGGSGLVSAANSTVTSDFSSIPADNTTVATITVTLRDNNNQPVAGKNVSVAANPPSATISISPTTATSGADGTAKFQVKASATGSAVFSASVTDVQVIFINQTVSITFSAPGTPPIPSGTPGAAVTGTPTNSRLLTVPIGPIEGRVVAWRLRVRQGPGLDFPILGLLQYNQRVSIIAKTVRGNWYQIQLQEGTAWVSAFWVRVTRSLARRLPVVEAEPGTAPLVPVPGTLLPQEGQGIGVVETYLLRVRSGPGTQFQQIGLLREGTEILLLGISPDRRWYLFQTQQGTAWTSALYVRVRSINGNRLPVVENAPRP